MFDFTPKHHEDSFDVYNEITSNKNKYANSSSSKSTATTSKNTDKDDKNQNDGNPSENNVSNTKVGTAVNHTSTEYDGRIERNGK